MFRVAEQLPLLVVSPKPWFPFQGLLRLVKPGYRPSPPGFEVQNGIETYFPRFLALPVFGRSLDGLSMAVCSWRLMRRIKRRFDFDIIDAHFAYPDGYAASLLARWFRVSATITLRGTEVPLSKLPLRRRLMQKALARVQRIFSVADALKRHVNSFGVAGDKIRVIGNGVDVEKFRPVAREEARRRLNLPLDARVLISVGGLVPRKGFHRVIAALPEVLKTHGNLHYLVVGGASPEGNNREELEMLCAKLGVADQVHFLGQIAPSELKWSLSAADVFVLSTSNEGWANVFLEAMACGLPVITTDVGGNREVVSDPDLGIVIPFGDHDALVKALSEGLDRQWDRNRIVAYAQENSWDSRVAALVAEFRCLGRDNTVVRGDGI